MTTALTVVVLVCFAYLLLVNLVAVVFLGDRCVRERRSQARRRQQRLRDAGDVTLHDPGQRDRRRVRRGGRHRVDRSLAARVRLSGVRGRRRERRLVGRDARAAEGRLRPGAVRDVRAPHLHDGARARDLPLPDHPNLVVVDKENGGKADAWNAALNVARYRYVCGVDADTVFDPKALLMAMRVAINDPARIVGVTSQITTARDPGRDPLGAGGATARRRRAARRLSAPRLHPRVPQQSPRLVDGSASCSARPAASRSGDGTSSRRSAATRRLHLRGHRAHLPHSRALSP